MSKKPSTSSPPKGSGASNSVTDAKKTAPSTTVAAPSSSGATSATTPAAAATTTTESPSTSRPISATTYQRRGVVNYDNYIDLIVAARVKKISYFIPSTVCRSPSKPQKVLLSKDDYNHLLGEIEGTLYDYQGRPEIDVLLINASINQEHLNFLDLAETYVQQTPALGTPLPRSNPDSRPISASKRRPGSATHTSGSGKEGGNTTAPEGIAANGAVSISKGATIGEVLGLQESKADEKGNTKDSSKDTKESSLQPTIRQTEGLPAIAPAKTTSSGGDGLIQTDTLFPKEGDIDDNASNVTPFPFTEPVLKTNFDDGTVKLLFDSPRGLFIMTEDVEIALMKLITEHIPAYKQLREQLMDGYDPNKLIEEESAAVLPPIPMATTTPKTAAKTLGAGKPVPSSSTVQGKPNTTGPGTVGKGTNNKPSSPTTANTKPKPPVNLAEESSIEEEEDLPPIIKIDKSRINFPKLGVPREDEEIVIVRSYMYIGKNKFNTMEPIREKLWRRFLRNEIFPLFDNVYKLAALRDIIWQEMEAVRLKALEELAAQQALLNIQTEETKPKKGGKKKGKKGKGKSKKKSKKADDEDDTEDDTEDEHSEMTGSLAGSNTSKVAEQPPLGNSSDLGKPPIGKAST